MHTLFFTVWIPGSVSYIANYYKLDANVYSLHSHMHMYSYPIWKYLASYNGVLYDTVGVLIILIKV